MDSILTQKLFIDGHLTEATSGETFETYNPATAEKLCDVQIASSNDVNQAVASAKKAFKTWSSWTGAERGRVLKKAADILRERNETLALLEVKDTGKPISEAAAVDICSGADAIEYFAGIAASLHGQHFDLGNNFAMTLREPLGVCAGIGAWNYPMQIACWKAAPALACGNTMVFKPSELTPLTATKLAEIFIEAGVPAGVFNVVQGDANTGMCLSQHPDIAKVSLTGY